MREVSNSKNGRNVGVMRDSRWVRGRASVRACQFAVCSLSKIRDTKMPAVTEYQSR